MEAKIKHHKYQSLVMHLYLLLKSAIGLDRSPSPDHFGGTGCDTCPASKASLASQVSLAWLALLSGFIECYMGG